MLSHLSVYYDQMLLQLRLYYINSSRLYMDLARYTVCISGQRFLPGHIYSRSQKYCTFHKDEKQSRVQDLCPDNLHFFSHEITKEEKMQH